MDLVHETKGSEALVRLLKEAPPAGVDPSTIAWPADAEALPADEAAQSEAGKAARERLTRARSEESKADSELRQAREEAGLDFGPDNAFYRLKGQCYDVKVNQYTYTACPFGTARQDSTNLG